MSLDFDSDDLPAGFDFAWERQATAHAEMRRPCGRPRVHVNREAVFFARLGPTADWRENRRRYHRERRARKAVK